jgi:hypothetical protein
VAVETSAVQISVNVVDNTSSQVLAGVEQNLTKLGAAGASVGPKVGAGLGQVGAGALSAHEKVRLLTEEFGVRIPRAMQSVISKCPAVMGAIGAVSGAMIALGAIQIGGMVFEAAVRGAEKLWHNVLNVNQAVEDYNAKVAKTKQDDFGNTQSIETTRLRINEATASVKQYEAEVEELKRRAASAATNPLFAAIPGGNALVSIHDTWWAHDAQVKQMEAQEQLDKLNKENLIEQRHEQKLDTIELEHAYDWRLSKEKEITEERRKQHEIDAEDSRHTSEVEGRYGNSVGTPHRGMALFSKGQMTEVFGTGAPISSTQGTKDLLADAKADKSLADLAGTGGGGTGDAKSQAQELARIHEQALESGLRGSALYHAQEAAAIEDLKRRGISSSQAVEDVHTKFHNEEMNRLRTQQAELEHMRQETQLMGLTGTARIKQEGENRIKNLSPDLAPGERLAMEHEIGQQTDQQVHAQDKTDAEERKKAADELAAKHQRSIEETEHIEAQARVKSLSAEKQKTASIQAELDEKLQRYKEELAGQADADVQYARRAAAAQAEANAEMVEANQDAHKKMAGEFDQLFEGMNHPLKYLEKLGDKTAGNAAASLVQHFQGTGKAADRTPDSGIFSDVFNGGKGGKMHGAAGMSAESSKMLSIASATIHVGSATISGAGGVSTGTGTGTASTAAGNAALGTGSTSTAVGGPAWSAKGSTTGGVGSGAGAEAGVHLAPDADAGSFGGAATAGMRTADGRNQSTHMPDISKAPGSTAAGYLGSISSLYQLGNKASVGTVTSDAPPGKGGFWKGMENDLYEEFPLAKEMKGVFQHPRQQQQQSDYLLKHLFHHQGSTTAGTGNQLNDANAGFARGSSSIGVGAGADTEPGTGSAVDSGSFGGAATAGPRAATDRDQTTHMPDTSKAPGSTAAGFLDSAESLNKTANQALDQKNSGTGTSRGSGARQDVSEGITAGQDVVGLYAAERGGGGAGGALKGAASGAQLGLMIGGPMGMVIGAAAGAIIGAVGSGQEARKYDLKTVRPRITADLEAYHSGSMDYLGAYSDGQSLQMEAAKTTTKMGPADGRYYQNTIKPELLQFMEKITAEQKAGRSMYTASGASYASGNPYVQETGLNLNHAGERIFSGVQNSDIVKAVTEGNRGQMPVQPASMGDVHLHVHAIDAKGVAGFLDQYKHNIRSAVNDSYAENSGGGL